MDLSPRATMKPCSLLSQAGISWYSFWTYSLAFVLILTLFPGLTARAKDIGFGRHGGHGRIGSTARAEDIGVYGPE